MTLDQHENERSPQREDANGAGAMRELARLWVRSYPAISAFITANVADAHHAEDLVQEVAQVVAEKFSEFDQQRSFVSWSLGIARLRILKYYRTQSRDRLVLSEEALVRIADALEHVDVHAEQRRDALRHCLGKLSGRRLTAIEMRYRDGLKVSDVAERLKTSSSAISVMLHRVRQSLMECVQKRLSGAETP
ncbi:RNA polymerase sigma factor [Botrimarina colliarenosi]|uniref:RNA polymerase sigma factor n=1 Tax=Botrimarina colliarenosi TaxID=2528001 RepID=A0A5C5ZZ65_9BACT|nr:sigma-70 family RNA polymerase sigma factor [Botrimarina colliarenosi]TWT92854.1 RNA polymerase sigma factor [Botrimarina colliarenosi]